MSAADFLPKQFAWIIAIEILGGHDMVEMGELKYFLFVHMSSPETEPKKSWKNFLKHWRGKNYCFLMDSTKIQWRRSWMPRIPV